MYSVLAFLQQKWPAMQLEADAGPACIVLRGQPILRWKSAKEDFTPLAAWHAVEAFKNVDVEDLLGQVPRQRRLDAPSPGRPLAG